MSGGIPSQISLDNAVVAQDEMGRPFIIVREYFPYLQRMSLMILVRVEKAGTVTKTSVTVVFPIY
jgi:hypothetical protein